MKRRELLGGAAALAVLGPADAFPSRNIRVVIPARQGGGADRLARVFDDFWGPLLVRALRISEGNVAILFSSTLGNVLGMPLALSLVASLFRRTRRL